MTPSLPAGPVAAGMALALVALGLAGCVGSPAAPPAPAALRSGAEAGLPGPASEVEALLTAARRGDLALQDVLRPAERFRGVASVALQALATRPGDLLPALTALLEAHGQAAGGSLPEVRALAGLPPDLADALAVLVRASLGARDLAAEAYGEPGAVDWARAFQAQRLQLAAVDAALPVLGRYAGGLAGAGSLDLCGVVSIAPGPVAHTYTCNYTLQVDLGGDDLYLNAAGGSFQLWTATLALDLEGNDRYLPTVPDHHGANGGAFQAVAALVDVAGDDVYDALAGEGAALNGGGDALGVGFLADLGGSDLVRGRGTVHEAVNGAGVLGAGHLVLAGGPDTVEAEGLTGSALNGGALLGSGLILARGGDRTYRARLDTEFGGAANGAAFGLAYGAIVDDGGATRYEGWLGNSSAGNGGSIGGWGGLHDFGGGDDVYLARAAPGSAVNGAALAGERGLLYDDGGRDLYDEVANATPRQDLTIVPKGRTGAQVDDARGTGAAAPAAPRADPWPDAARPVLQALARAAAHGFAPPDIHAAALALAGGSPADAGRPGDLLPLARALVAGQGLALGPGEVQVLMALPRDLQQGLAGLLGAHAAATRLTAEALAAESPDLGRLAAARGLLVEAAHAARPTLLRYADRPLAGAVVDVCPVLHLDLRGGPAETSCHYLVQVSTGGATTYRNRAGGSLFRGSVALLVDAAGDDRYLGPDDGDRKRLVFGGSGEAGVGVLVDYQGDDLYAPSCGRAGCTAIGAGVGGAGGLVDYEGRDIYRGGVAATDQKNGVIVNGAALVGSGFLADLAGDDLYEALGPDTSLLNAGAAFLGNGFLFDRAGDDTYRAAGGAHSLMNAGVLEASALLFDVEGHDLYWAEASHHGISNGAGFWGTPGSWLLDGAGDDSYVAIATESHTGVQTEDLVSNGRYYRVGTCPLPSGCGKGAAGLVDLGGRDAYLEWMAVAGASQGHAHDHQGGQPMQGNATMPEPTYDATVLPKGAFGAQLDLQGVGLGAYLQRAARPGDGA